MKPLLMATPGGMWPKWGTHSLTHSLCPQIASAATATAKPHLKDKAPIPQSGFIGIEANFRESTHSVINLGGAERGRVIIPLSPKPSPSQMNPGNRGHYRVWCFTESAQLMPDNNNNISALHIILY